jgi:hypothetical protein
VVPTPNIDCGAFCKLLAKIAHSFSVASLGYGGFKPYLCGLIRSPAEDATDGPYFVGGPIEQSEAKLIDSITCYDISQRLGQHTATLFSHIAEGKSLYVVRVQFFTAMVLGPYYDVVVGESNNAKTRA